MPDHIGIEATITAARAPEPAKPPGSWHDFERLRVVQAIDAEMMVEREDARDAEMFGDDERGVGQVHRGIPVSLHEDLHPIGRGRSGIVEHECMIPDMSPE